MIVKLISEMKDNNQDFQEEDIKKVIMIKIKKI